MTEVTVEIIKQTTKTALQAHGAADWICEHVADAVAIAESVGNRICGLYYLESYCLQLQSGRVNGTAELAVTSAKAGAVHVDAKMGFAQSAFARGLPVAVEAAQKIGFGVQRHAGTSAS